MVEEFSRTRLCQCVMFTEVEGQAERRINIYLKPGLRLLWRCLVLYDSMWMRAAMI
jgi:hypothetical protein